MGDAHRHRRDGGGNGGLRHHPADGPVPDPGSIGGPFRAPVFRGTRGTIVDGGTPAPCGFNILDIDAVTGASRAVVTGKAGVYLSSNGSVNQVWTAC